MGTLNARLKLWPNSANTLRPPVERTPNVCVPPSKWLCHALMHNTILLPKRQVERRAPFSDAGVVSGQIDYFQLYQEPHHVRR